MPKFITISTTHVKGKKKFAWENFLKGGYIAVGWYHTDYTGWSWQQIEADIRNQVVKKTSYAVSAHKIFFQIEIGDIVAVNNVNHGLFGIGVVKSAYKFEKYKHDTGHLDKIEFSSHYIEVDWLVDIYHKSKDILLEGEKCWPTMGTIHKSDVIPAYITRFLESKGKSIKPETDAPDREADFELIGYEGKIKEELKLHKSRERDLAFARDYKQKYRHIESCEGCGLNPKQKFDIETIDFLDLHHINPLSERSSSENSFTKEEEMALLCPNCHRLAHKLMSLETGRTVTIRDLKSFL